jgi:hypothetical protein
MGIIGDHDVDRLASEIGADKTAGRARAAAAVLMLQPFPPVIYYGDELGMLGRAGSYDSDANDIPRREPFKWGPVAADSPSLAWILRTFPKNLLPVSAYAQQLTDLQLGYALWLAVLVGGVLVWLFNRPSGPSAASSAWVSVAQHGVRF